MASATIIMMSIMAIRDHAFENNIDRLLPLSSVVMVIMKLLVAERGVDVDSTFSLAVRVAAAVLMFPAPVATTVSV